MRRSMLSIKKCNVTTINYCIVYNKINYFNYNPHEAISYSNRKYNAIKPQILNIDTVGL